VSRSISLLLLLAIVVPGSALRLYGIDKESFWLDEMASVRISASPLPGPFITQLRSDDPYHPPLYFLILRGWRALVGDGEAKLRLLSALFGVLTLPIIYIVGASLFDRRAGLIAALLLALSAENIAMAQEARCYTLLVLLTALSCYFFFRWTMKGSRSAGLFYAVTSVAALYTSYLFVLILASQFLFYVLTLRSARVRFVVIVATCVAIALLFAPWVWALAQGLGTLFSRNIRPYDTSVSHVARTFGTYIAFVGGNSLTTVLFFLVMLLGTFAVEKREGAWRWKEPLASLEGTTLRMEGVLSSAFLWIWLIVPVFTLCFVAVMLQQQIFGAGRYVLYVSVPFYVLLARGVTRSRVVGVAAAVLALALMTVSLVNYYSTPHKPAWKEAATYISAEAEPGEVVLVGKLGIWAAEYYFNPRLTVDACLERREDIPGAITQRLDHRRRLWVIVGKDDGSWIDALEASGVIKVTQRKIGYTSIYRVEVVTPGNIADETEKELTGGEPQT